MLVPRPGPRDVAPSVLAPGPVLVDLDLSPSPPRKNWKDDEVDFFGDGVCGYSIVNTCR